MLLLRQSSYELVCFLHLTPLLPCGLGGDVFQMVQLQEWNLSQPKARKIHSGKQQNSQVIKHNI